MKIFGSIGLSALAAILLSIPTMAHASGGYNCSLDGRVHGASIGFVISGQVLSGAGVITCRHSSTGKITKRNVRLSLVGGGVGFDLTIIHSLRVHAAGIDSAHGLADFTGSFSVGANIGATVLADGVGAYSALRVSNKGLGFYLGLIGESATGLGVRLQGMVLTISAT